MKDISFNIKFFEKSWVSNPDKYEGIITYDTINIESYSTFTTESEKCTVGISNFRKPKLLASVLLSAAGSMLQEDLKAQHIKEELEKHIAMYITCVTHGKKIRSQLTKFQWLPLGKDWALHYDTFINTFPDRDELSLTCNTIQTKDVFVMPEKDAEGKKNLFDQNKIKCGQSGFDLDIVIQPVYFWHSFKHITEYK